LMAYSKGMPGGRQLRYELQQVTSLEQLGHVREQHLSQSGEFAWASDEEAAVLAG
jgi:hypothetical protein